MTSTTSYKVPKQGVRIFGWTIKQKTATIAVYTAMLFIAYPLLLLFIRTATFARQSRYGSSYGDILAEINQYSTGIYNLCLVGIVMLFSIIVGVSVFSYLHNKRQADLFGAFPVNRRTMFFSRYFGAIAICLIPALIISVIGGLLSLPSMDALMNIFWSFLFLTLGVVANISFIGLLSICCGTTIDTIISYIIISSVYPLGMLLISIFPTNILPGFELSAQFSGLVYTALSPFVSVFMIRFPYLDFVNEEVTSAMVKDCVLHTGYWLVFIGVCVGLTYALVKKRKAEAAQNGFAFKLPQYIIIVFTSAVVGVFLGFIAASVTGGASNMSVLSQYFWFWVFMAVGAFISVLVLQVIYNKGFKGFVKNIIAYGVMMAVAVILFITLITGWFGVDVRVPKANQVKAVSITTVSHNDVWLTDKEVINKVIDLHADITGKVRDVRGYPYRLFNENYYWEKTESGKYEMVSLSYQLTDGTTMERTYRAYRDYRHDIDEKVETIIESDVYNKAVAEQTLSIAPNNLENVEFASYENGQRESTNLLPDTVRNEKTMKALIDAIKKDIEADSGAVIFNNSFMERSAEEEDDSGTVFYEIMFSYRTETGYHTTPYVQIKPSYSNTLQQLKALGLISKVSRESINGIETYITEETITDSNGNIYFEAPKAWEGMDIYCKLYFQGDAYAPAYSQQEICTKAGGNLYQYRVPKIEKVFEKSQHDAYYGNSEEEIYEKYGTDVDWEEIVFYAVPKNGRQQSTESTITVYYSGVNMLYKVSGSSTDTPVVIKGEAYTANRR